MIYIITEAIQPHRRVENNAYGIKKSQQNHILTAGAASSAPSAVEKITWFSPFSFTNFGPNCNERKMRS
jgi:hypothetical protein